jgi:P-type conjugative transfer protein TrbG
MSARLAFATVALVCVSMPLPAHAQSLASTQTEPCLASRRVRCPAPGERLAAANAAARQRLGDATFEGARQLYLYAPGALYELLASPGYISSILLQPGEAVTAIAAGDTARWMVTEAEAQASVEPRAVVLVKPLAAGVRTNIVIITDRRTYTIEARAASGDAYAAEIAWSYPAVESAQHRGGAVDTLNFAYRVRTVRGAAPAWAPARVFDDGARTYVEFAPDVAVRDMPPIFVITAEGAELANYRVVGQRMIVDRLFDRAELRIGVRAPVIVRIDREAAAVERRRARRGGRP